MWLTVCMMGRPYFCSVPCLRWQSLCSVRSKDFALYVSCGSALAPLHPQLNPHEQPLPSALRRTLALGTERRSQPVTRSAWDLASSATSRKVPSMPGFFRLALQHGVHAGCKARRGWPLPQCAAVLSPEVLQPLAPAPCLSGAAPSTTDIASRTCHGFLSIRSVPKGLVGVTIEPPCARETHCSRAGAAAAWAGTG